MQFIVNQFADHILTKNIFVSLQIKPRERTILNLKTETAAILWLDETVKNRRLFCLNVVPKNIHSSTRFILSLKKVFIEFLSDFACSRPVS